MKNFAVLVFISLAAGIAVIGLTPGCDELVTQEVFRDTTIVETIRDSACIEFCHSDANTAMDIAIKRWESSDHANAEIFEYFLAGQEAIDCGPQCHTREGFVQSVSGETVDVSYPTELDCFSCHQPHTTFDFAVRDSSSITLIDGGVYDRQVSNLCANCHKLIMAKADVVYDGVTIQELEWGPVTSHATSASELLLGLGGHEYEGYTYANSHAGAVTGGCLTCHMDKTKEFTLGGHTFNIRSESAYLTEGCNIPGCHQAVPLDTVTIDSMQAYLAVKLDSLKNKLIEIGLLNDITELPQSEVTVPNADSAGAMYNYFLVSRDASGGMHNWEYDTMLVRSSLDYLYQDTLPPAQND